MPVVIYNYEIWTASEGDFSRIRAVKMSFLRMAVGLERVEVSNNRKVYEVVRIEE